MTSQDFSDWTEVAGSMTLRFNEYGEPNESAHIERFMWTARTEVLSAHLRHSVIQVQRFTEGSLLEYNERHRRGALAVLPLRQ